MTSAREPDHSEHHRAVWVVALFAGSSKARISQYQKPLEPFATDPSLISQGPNGVDRSSAKGRRKQANRHVRARVAPTHRNVSEPTALIPKNVLRNTWSRPAPQARPTSRPIASSFIPETKIGSSTSPLLAPSAMRMPISRVRNATDQATTP